jgi:hypothetical protein
MIYTFIAYAPKEHDRDLAWAYNEFMKLLPNDDDWACFIDHDAMFTTTDWYPQLEKIVEENPGYSCLCCATNGAYAEWQIPIGINRINHDIKYHRKIGAELQEANGDRVVDVTECSNLPAPLDSSPLSGVVILYKKSAWKEVPFRLLEPNRLTGIDNLLHLDLRDKGHKVGLMSGIYVYHWHRADGVNVADAINSPELPVPIPTLPVKNETHLIQEHHPVVENEDGSKTTVIPFDDREIAFKCKPKEEVGMDIKRAIGKIEKCTDDNFIVIGAPLAYDNEIDVATCLWIEHHKRKPNMMALYEPSRFAAHGRNNVIYKTLQHLPGVTHIFFIDKDVVPPVDAIERLLAHDKDIIVGATPIYKGEPAWSVMKYDPEQTIDNIFEPVPYGELPDKPFRAHHFGGTTCLIKRHVFEEMQYPWYQDVLAPGALILGQDLFFTAKAKQFGFELWCDPTVRCEHRRQAELKTLFDNILEKKKEDVVELDKFKDASNKFQLEIANICRGIDENGDDQYDVKSKLEQLYMEMADVKVNN